MTTDSPAPIRRADSPDSIAITGLVDNPITATRRPGPLATLLGDAKPTGDHGSVQSGDGLFTASIPLTMLRHALISDDGRLDLADSPTRCWLVKDVRQIEITDGRQPDSLPDEERAKT